MISRQLNEETSELSIKVKADKNTWQETQKKVFDELKNNLIVKGYRKGKAPAEIAKKHINQKDIWSKSVNKMLDELVKMANESLTNEDKILDAPNYNIDKITNSELEVTFIYPIYPNIKISNYKNTDIKFTKKAVNKELITQELENLREKHALLSKKDTRIEKGDLVKFDFEGFVDGKPFEGGKAEDFILEIGSGKFIPGFEEQMIGLKPSESKDIKVTFPEKYHVEELKNKPAIFKIFIKEVKTKTLPELNDEFAKETGMKGVNNLQDLTAHLEKLFEEQMQMESKHEFVAKLFDKIKKETKIIVPKQLIMRELQAITNHFENNLKRQKWTVEDYAKMTGVTKEKLFDEFKTQAQERLIDSFIFAEIARLENIKPSEEDFEVQYEKLAKIYKKPINEMKKLVTKAQAQVPIINEKVIDLLIETNS